MELTKAEKTQRNAELLRQTREVWDAICRAKPGKRLGRFIWDSNGFDSLQDDDKIWCAKLTMALRPIMAPRALSAKAGNNPEPQSGEVETPAEPNSAPPNSENSETSAKDAGNAAGKTNGAIQPDAVTDNQGNDVTPPETSEGAS